MNYRIDTIYSIFSNEDEKRRQYEVVVDYIKLSQNSEEISFTEKWNVTKDSVSLIPNAHFEANSQIGVTIKVHWEVLENGIWIIPQDAYYEEIESIADIVKVSTTEIDKSNIKYSYPIPNQYHFLQNESNKGFVGLIAPQNELLQANNAIIKARITNLDDYLFESSVDYNSEDYFIEFNMPPNLDNEKIYKLELIKTIDSQENIIYSSHFRTSIFNSFSEKIEDIDSQGASMWALRPMVHLIYSGYGNLPEYFDEFEKVPLVGLIRFKLDTSSTAYSEYLYPKLYKYIDLIGADFSRENLSSTVLNDIIDTSYIEKYNIDLDKSIHLPPLNTFKMRQSSNSSIILTENYIANDYAPPIEVDMGLTIDCSLASIAKYDYYTATQWLVSEYWDDEEEPQWATAIYTDYFHPLSMQGFWKFKIQYVLPNGEITSEKEITWDIDY